MQFCLQQEILCAIEEEVTAHIPQYRERCSRDPHSTLQESRGLHIQLVIEEEPRFANFDVPEWHASRHPPSQAKLREAIQAAQDNMAVCVQQLSTLLAEGGDPDLKVQELRGEQECIAKLQAQLDAPDSTDGSRIFKGKVSDCRTALSSCSSRPAGSLYQLRSLPWWTSIYILQWCSGVVISKKRFLLVLWVCG